MLIGVLCYVVIVLDCGIDVVVLIVIVGVMSIMLCVSGLLIDVVNIVCFFFVV